MFDSITFRCDQGTNFVGANNDLKFLENMGKSHVKSFLISKNCKIDFFFNPPSASHFCGVFESQISTICKVLFGLLLKQSSSLSDECLSNLLHEVSAIINCLTLSHFNLFDLYNKPVCPN